MKFDIDYWNGHNPSDATLEDVIQDWRRDGGEVLFLMEMWTKRKTLKRLAKKYKCKLYQEANIGRGGSVVNEQGSSAVLVVKSSRVRVSNFSWIVQSLRWLVFSANRWHAPRRHARMRLIVDGYRVRFFGFHFPTNGHDGGNSKAWWDSMRDVIRFFENKSVNTLSIAGGDGNESVKEFDQILGLNSVSVKGHSPDITAVKGGTQKHKVLSKSGSDHHRIRVEYTTYPELKPVLRHRKKAKK